MPLSDVVNVSITRETASVAQESFDIIGVISREINSDVPVDFISSPDEIGAKLHGGTGGPTYRTIQAIFSQNPRPRQVALIPVKTAVIAYYSGALQAGDTVKMTVNGQVFPQVYSVNTDGTLDALATQINAVFGAGVATRSAGLFIVDTGSSTLKLSVSIDLSDVASAFTFAVGHALDITFNGDNWTAEGAVVFKINGTAVSVPYNSSVDTTMGTSVKTALLAAFPELADVIWDTTPNRLTLLSKKNAEIFLQSVTFPGITGTMAFVSAQVRLDDDGIGAVLDAAKVYDGSFYALVYVPYNVDTAEIANVKAIADWSEANNKIFGIASDETNIINQAVSSDSTTLAYYIKNKGHVRSFVAYSPYASASSGTYEHPAAAVLGKSLTWTPGSYTLKFKTLAGISAYKLTASQEKNANDKNVNTYVLLAGRGIFQQGTTGEGEFIDTIIFSDWIKSLIETNVVIAFLNNKKIPFDDIGLGIIGGKLSAALESGVVSGGFTAHQKDEEGNVIGGYVISVPRAIDIPVADKLARRISSARPITFVGYLSGAIHSVTIQGKITV